MARATWNGVVLAESGETKIVEGNHYFPPESINREHFAASDHHTHCGWKGQASYYHVQADGQTNENAAWYYADPKPEAAAIKGFIAFWKGVQVEGEGTDVDATGVCES